jgi:hypothetical protein
MIPIDGLFVFRLNGRRFADEAHSWSPISLKTAVLSIEPCSISVPGPLPNPTTSSTVLSADFE